MGNCERKILQIQGGIAACEDLIKESKETNEKAQFLQGYFDQ